MSLSTYLAPPAPVLVIGAGTMGIGIAQVAAQAGHAVWLHDCRERAAADAKCKLTRTLEGLVQKGRLTGEAAQGILSRIEPIPDLTHAAGAHLVVEAIVENLDTKHELLTRLEGIVSPQTVLASNTSSISLTALARGMKHPGRVVGMHFFNPVPLMKLVEVVSGLKTDPAIAAAVHHIAKAWGKQPVHARSTPGFIVNRIARPFYAEGLALLQERAAEPAVIDACLRAAGFRMGPCELMDLIGHDTNFAVTDSVYHATFGDKRFVPSAVQRELVEGGLLGRKSGQGFYEYTGRSPEPAPTPATPAALPYTDAAIVLHGSGGTVERWATRLAEAGRPHERRTDSLWTGLEAGDAQLRLTDGRPAAQAACEARVPDLAVFDVTALLHSDLSAHAGLAWSAAAVSRSAWREQVPQWLAAAGHVPHAIGDAAGLIVARTLAMLINEAADAVQQGVCTEEAADQAMKLGVNYPAGPFEWLGRWDPTDVMTLLDHLDSHYRGERYRVSPWLRQAAWRAQLTPSRQEPR